MADKQTLQTTAKAGSLASALIIALTQLPEPYSHYVGYVLTGVGIIGLIGTQIPAPPQNSKWMPAYRVLSYLAANWGQAINAGIAAREVNKKP